MEILLWVLVVGTVIGMRVYLWHLLPAYFWSDDGNSYALPAFKFLDGADLIFDGRRGPTYTLLILAALKIFGACNGVVWIQQCLGGLAVLISIAVARIWWGRAAVLPLFICGMALALYGLPLHLAQLIRNETLLLLFSTLAFGAWWLALKWDRVGWFFLAALATALLTMTKNVFVVFPLVLCASVFFCSSPGWRGRAWRLGALAIGFALPYGALKMHDATARTVAVPKPQSGLLFFGRTAQWTKLDGGIEQEWKDLIRADIEQYRKLPKRDNNIILYRSAVPRMEDEMEKRGMTPTDLDRLCRRFAIEAVRDQPAAFARQILSDLQHLHFRAGVKNEFPSDKQLIDARKTLGIVKEQRGFHPTMEGESTDAILAARVAGDPFRTFHRLLNRAWMFQGYPVLYTTLSLLVLLVMTREKTRFFFAGAAAVWFSNMLLLSTVGRPLERYLMPLVPLMFWAMSGVIIVAWLALLRLAGGLTPPPATPTTGAP